MTLQSLLNGFLGTSKRPRAPDTQRRHREAFKRLVAARGGTYIVSRDGYVEIVGIAGYPLGITICHHGWDETLERLQEALDDPSTLDEGGYHNV